MWLWSSRRASARPVEQMAQVSCCAYRCRMARPLFDWVLALACTVLVAFMLATITGDEGVPLATIRTDALSAAGLIFAVVACRSLLQRK